MADQIQEPPTKRFKPNTIKIDKPMAIVLDIEGTIMSKSFYDKELLPYARDNMRDFLYQNNDVKYIRKRLEMIKERHFEEHPEKEQLFNDYFTESAYNKYLGDIKQRAVKQIEINQNQTETNAISSENDVELIEIDENNRNILEIDNKLEIIDNESVIVLNDIDNNTESIEIINIDNNNDDDDVIELIDIIDIDEDDDIVNDDYSLSDCSALSKTSFYKEREIDLLMDIIDEWFDLNVKIKPLQYIEGLLIQKGFRSNHIFGDIFSDFYSAIIKWKKKDKNINIYIYSHGTKAAQKLIFKYSVFGDLSEYISDYFDCHSTGNKKDKMSYIQLLRDIQSHQWDNQNEYTEDHMMESILFISDHTKELEAAQNAGLTVIQSVRESNKTDTNYPQMTDFNQIQWIDPLPLLTKNNSLIL